jgi:hypothetical protein
MNQEQKISARERMEYNSSREKLEIAEYGRHVQKMIDHAKTIEDKEQRQFFFEMIVELMGQILPNNKPSPEQTNKLWNHAMMIANYDIDVEPPKDVNIVKHTEQVHPPKLPYPTSNKKYRHYGVNVQKLIEKAAEVEDPEKQKEFAVAIGSYMKMAYKTWSPEHYMNDESIKGDLKAISKGNIDLEDDVSLDFLKNVKHSPKNQTRRKSGKSRSKRNRRRR